MISRVACVPRICQSCRQGLLFRRNPASNTARFFHPDSLLQRSNEHPTIQSKARVEALISGKPWEDDKPSKNKNRRNTKSQRAQDDELPDWGLTSEEKKATTQQNKASRNRKSRRSTSNSGGGTRFHAPNKTDHTSQRTNSNGKGRANSMDASDKKHENFKRRNKSTSQGTRSSERRQNSVRRDRATSKDTVKDVEIFQNPESKENLTFEETTNAEEDQNPKDQSKPILEDTTTTFGRENTLIETSGASGSITKPEVSESDSILGQILEEESSSNSLGFTPKINNISEPGVSKAKKTYNPASQRNIKFAIAQQDEESPMLPSSRSHAKKEFKHQLLQKHSLSISALGKDISALVLSNPNKLKPKSKPQISIPRERMGLDAGLDWRKLLPVDVENLDISAEVSTNIEELRPKDSSVIKAKDFMKLINDLVLGFTKEQLATYFRQTREIDDTPINKPQQYPWLLGKTAWVSLTPVRLGQITPKRNVATLILKDAWALDIQEEVEELGITSVTLRPDVFELISNPSTGALVSLQSDILDESNNEEIIPSEKNHEIQIHARKASIRAILSRIDEAAQSMQSQKISVEDFHPNELRRDVLDRLSSITKTSIQYHKEDSKLDIMWLGQGSPAAITNPTAGVPNTQVESPADVVLRLLQDRPLHLEGDIEVVSSYSKSTAAKMGMFIHHGREFRSLSWRQKMMAWSRYVLPIGKSTTMKPPKLGLAQKKNLFRDTQELDIDGAEPQLAAAFGYILHTAQNPSLSRSDGVLSRILLPVLPHPGAFTEISGEGEMQAPLAKSSSIVLNFIPTERDSEAPEVRLSLPVNADDDFSDFTMSHESKLYAVSPIHQQDLLFPQESVDARLTQQNVLPLDIARQPHIQEFFNASEFNLVEGRLRTPSHTQISLPSQWLPSASNGAQATAEVAYSFAGLEIHQTMDLEWQGHNLRYNSIEAGQHGGTRQELSLRALSGVEVPNTSTETEKTAFLELVEGIVTGRFFSWAEGAKAIREIPDEYDPDDAQDQDNDDADAFELSTPDLDVEDVWPHPEDEAHRSSSEPTSIYEEGDQTLESGEELAVAVREVLNGGDSTDEIQSSFAISQYEDVVQASERLVTMIEETLASQEASASLEADTASTGDHLASGFANTGAEAESVLRTAKELTTMVEEALAKQENP